MPVGNVAFPVGVNSVFGGVSQQVHDMLVLGEALSFGALPALDQSRRGSGKSCLAGPLFCGLTFHSLEG